MSTIDALVSDEKNNKLQKVLVTDPLSQVHYVKVSFNILGLTCAACVRSAELGLEKLEGVKPGSINVNLLMGKCSLQIEKSLLDVELIKTAIHNTGFDLDDIITEDSNKRLSRDDVDDIKGLKADFSSVTTNLIIGGMTCASCVASVQRIVESLPGVESCNINLLTGDGAITHLPQLTGPRTLIESIEKAGFTARLNPNSSSNNGDLSNASKSVRERAEKQERLLRRRFLISLIFAIPTFIIGMFFMMFLKDTKFTQNYLGLQVFPGLGLSTLILFMLATPVQFYLGYPFYVKSYRSIRYARTANMDTLVALGTSVAYFGSIISVLIGIIHANRNDMEQNQESMDGQEFFETSVFLITFIWLGKWMEAKAKGKTFETITKLMELQPEKAILVRTNSSENVVEEQEIDMNLVQVGDILKVNAGARIPCDGRITKGTTSIDESMITGESIPVIKSVNDDVICATVNQSSTILIEAIRVGSDTTLSRIITLVQEAQSSKKAPIEELADKISRVFVPLVISMSIIVFACWAVAGAVGSYPEDWVPYNESHLTFALFFSIAVMVIACPCALGLASPTAIMVGTGVAAKFGILVKGGGEALQRASKINIIAFDKTGTLTYGKPKVVKTMIFVKDAEENGGEKRTVKNLLLQIVGVVESSSDHPLAKAVSNHVVSKLSGEKENNKTENMQQNLAKHLENVSLVDVAEIPGKGLKAVVNVRSTFCRNIIVNEVLDDKSQNESVNYNVYVGNEDWIKEENCVYPSPRSQEFEDTIVSWRKLGCSIVMVGLSVADDEANRESNNSRVIAAIFGVTDTPRPDAKKTVSALTSMGIHVWMITGDHSVAAKVIASKVGIKHVLAQVTPEKKAQKIKWLQKKGHLAASPKSSKNDPNMKAKIYTNASNVSTKRPVVAMIGDGINDSPALAQADLGISISNASDIAIESSSVILTRSTLSSLVTMIVLSRAIIKRIQLNFIWAFLYNACSIPIAAGILFPVFKIGLPPALAGLLMVGSSLSVLMSSLLLRRFKEPTL
ncbi:14571_t:CDS:2 [Acaulospora morrowiae]|uniref:P-type Cu(+) transporter n=1 Tax=Acaulospora morrowiae TaxID=94023 RepID=A0A9N8ZUT5_9GLOM|nr:14571_t:CDS:2 [Acaulospora morrowiae]